MGELTIVYAREAFPASGVPSVFLAGPTPRSQEVASWRPEVIAEFRRRGYRGYLFVPEDRGGKFRGAYLDQVEWERRGREERATCILFWVPRDLKTLPGFTTNVEFGLDARSGKVVLGAPPEAPKMRYLRWVAEREGIPQAETISGTVDLALKMVGRQGGGFALREIPRR